MFDYAITISAGYVITYPEQHCWIASADARSFERKEETRTAESGFGAVWRDTSSGTQQGQLP